MQVPYVLGVHSSYFAQQAMTVADLLDGFGRNTGNILFTEGLTAALAGAERRVLNFDTRDVPASATIVLAAANWLNPYSDFGWLVDSLETINNPVCCVGLGAQADDASVIPQLQPGTKRLVEFLAQRGGPISARGRYSANVLAHYGCTNVLVTGCPSMLLAGASGLQTRSPIELSRRVVVVSATRHQDWSTDQHNIALYRYALKHKLDLHLQSELIDMYYALNRTNNPSILTRIDPILTSVYDTPIGNIREFLRRHGKVFFELPTLRSYLATKHFYFGSRLHGCIASYLSGTPAVLLTHDSRTREIAESMTIPYRELSTVDFEKPLWTQLYSPDEVARFEHSYDKYLSTFRRFFDAHSLAMTF
jgi:hypothetical protein